MVEFSNPSEREVLARLVSMSLGRSGLFTSFPRILEKRYEADGRERRIASLKASIILGLVIYNLFVFADVVLVPDVVGFGFLVRSVVLTPFGVLLYFVVDKPFLSCRWREALISAATTIFSLGPLVIFAASTSEQSAYILPQTLLILFFGSNVLHLRRVHAVVMFAVNFLATMIVVAFHAGIPADLTAVFLSYTACTSLFGFMCNYSIERSGRDAYLLSLQERLRSAGLSEDRNKLAVLSETDWLTGIANRRSLDHRIDAIWSDPSRSAAASIILLDIDHFKRFNDFYGHIGGDQCLRRLSDLFVEACARPGVFLSRYGGEEFAIAVEGMTEADVTAFADDLCRSVAKAKVPHLGRIDGLSIVTISLGVARMGDDTVTDRHSLFAAADKALYSAKRIGRNRVVRYGSLEMSIATAFPQGAGDVRRVRSGRSAPDEQPPARLAG